MSSSVMAGESARMTTERGPENKRLSVPQTFPRREVLARRAGSDLTNTV